MQVPTVNGKRRKLESWRTKANGQEPLKGKPTLDLVFDRKKTGKPAAQLPNGKLVTVDPRSTTKWNVTTDPRSIICTCVLVEEGGKTVLIRAIRPNPNYTPSGSGGIGKARKKARKK